MLASEHTVAVLICVPGAPSGPWPSSVSHGHIGTGQFNCQRIIFAYFILKEKNHKV